MSLAKARNGAGPRTIAGGRLRGWIPELVLLVVTTAAGVFAGGRWVDPTSDPGLWWSLSTRLAEGERYYRDLLHQYGPLTPYLLALGVRLLGFSITWVLLSNWLPAILAGILLLRAGREHLSSFERLSVVGLVIGLGLFAPGRGRLVYPYSPAAVHALCLSLGALLLARRPEKAGPRRLLPGALAGLAFLSKQEIGVAAIVSLLSLSAVAPGGRFRRALAAVAGFVLGVLPGIAFALWSAPLASLREESRVWPLGGVPAGWAPLYRIVAGVGAVGWARQLAESLGAFLFYFSVLALFGLLISGERRPRRFLLPAAISSLVVAVGLAGGVWIPGKLHFVSLSMLAAATVVLLALFDRELPGGDFLVAFGVFSGLLAARTAVSTDVGGPYAGVAHFGTALLWPLLLFVLLPRRFPGGEGASRATRRVGALALLPFAWMGAATGMESLADPVRVAVDSKVGRFWVEPRQAGLFAAIRGELRPGERVLVLPETNGVDAIYGVRPVSRYVTLMPGFLDHRVERQLLAQFHDHPPDAVVVFERGTAEYRVAPLGRGFGRELMEWIEGNYEVVLSAAAGKILRQAPGR